MTILDFLFLFSVMVPFIILFIYAFQIILIDKRIKKHEVELQICKQIIADALNKRLEEKEEENE